MNVQSEASYNTSYFLLLILKFVTFYEKSLIFSKIVYNKAVFGEVPEWLNGTAC